MFWVQILLAGGPWLFKDCLGKPFLFSSERQASELTEVWLTAKRFSDRIYRIIPAHSVPIN